MKIKPLPFILLVSAVAALSSRADSAKPAASPAAETNSAPKEAVIPPSTFALGAGTRDPFYPNSTRLAASAAPTNSGPVFNTSSLLLKALSGPAGRRLAMINNRTLAAGEKAEVGTVAGKVTVYCDEVRETSVVIHTESQPQPIEIYLRKGAR